MEGAVRRASGISRLDACCAEDLLADALEGVEVAVTVEADHDLDSFVGKSAFQTVNVGNDVFSRDIDLCKLIERSVCGAVVPVELQNLHHRGNGCGTHGLGVLTERVHDFHRFASAIVFCKTCLIIKLCGHKGIGDDLVKTASAEKTVNVLLELLFCGKTALCHRGNDVAGFDLVIAVDTNDFFCDIVHATNVIAIGGNGDDIAVHLEIKAFEDLDHFFRGKVDAEEFIDSFGFELHGCDLFLDGVNVDDAVYDLACAEKVYKLARSFECGNGVFGVKTLFKTGGGVCTHTELLCGHADGATEEHRGFKDNGRGIVLDLAVCAAHNACDGNGLFAVGNDEHIGFEISFLIVERHELFFVACGSDLDVLAVKTSVVEGVHRLTVFEHDVVRDIYDIIDGTNARCAKSHTEPKRRGCDLYVLYDTRAVTEAFFCVMDGDIDIICNIVARFLDGGCGDLRGLFKACRAFSCKTDNGKTVGAVRGDLKFDRLIAHTENVYDIVAGLVGKLFICIENEDTVGGCVRHIVEGKTKLLDGAEHTFGNLAAELTAFDLMTACELGHSLFISGAIANGNVCALKDVFRCGHDLNRLFAAVYLTDHESFCVGVLFDFLDQTDSDILNLVTEELKALDLGACVGHSVAIFFDVNIVAIHKIGKPFH